MALSISIMPQKAYAPGSDQVQYTVPDVNNTGVYGYLFLHDMGDSLTYWAPIGCVEGNFYNVVEIGIRRHADFIWFHFDYFITIFDHGNSATVWSDDFTGYLDHYFKIERNSANPNVWDFYIDGSRVWQHNFGYTWTADKCVSTLETYNSFDGCTPGSEISSWSNLLYKRSSDGTWLDWDNCVFTYTNYWVAGFMYQNIRDDYYYTYVINKGDDHTRYFENTLAYDQGIWAYVFGRNTGTPDSGVSMSSADCQIAAWGLKFFVRRADGSEYQLNPVLGDGFNAIVSQFTGQGPETITTSWTPTSARDEYWYDSTVFIRLYGKFDTYDWVERAKFQTESFNLRAVEPTLWTIDCYVRTWNAGGPGNGPLMTYSRFYIGQSYSHIHNIRLTYYP